MCVVRFHLCAVENEKIEMKRRRKKKDLRYGLQFVNS